MKVLANGAAPEGGVVDQCKQQIDPARKSRVGQNGSGKVSQKQRGQELRDRPDGDEDAE